MVPINIEEKEVKKDIAGYLKGGGSLNLRRVERGSEVEVVQKRRAQAFQLPCLHSENYD